jgi:hypothetical protein
MVGKLSEKRILFIGPVFHDYHSAIIEKLQTAGAIVDFFPERRYGVSFKIINNIFKSGLAAYQQRHYDRILDLTEGRKYDYLFVIKGYMLSNAFVETFKRRNPAAITIMYQWDSNRAHPFSHLVESFDRVHSFDFEDCENLPALNYLPLFYTDDVKQVAMQQRPHGEFDFFFLGSYFPERYAAMINFREYVEKNGWKLRAFLYIPFTYYVKERLKGVKLDRSIISLKQMPRSEYLDTLSRSRVMVDVSSPRQTGLAMRIIEAFACRTKVLTNNRRLEEDKLYTPEYVAFFDDKMPRVDKAFVTSSPQVQSIGVLSIGEWLERIFEGTY